MTYNIPVPVIVRQERNGNFLAVFPDRPASIYDPSLCDIAALFGWTSADPRILIRETRPVSSDVAEQFIARISPIIGYDLVRRLVVRKRVTRLMEFNRNMLLIAHADTAERAAV